MRAVYQPIVELASGRIVAYEALARGPEGSPLESPLALFAAAREAGLVEQLDWTCRVAALEGALAAGLQRPLRLFVNAAADAIDAPPPSGIAQLMARVATQLDVVLEITEQAIASRPAEMLLTVDRVRAAGLAVALDDVGADPRSLALVPLVSPEVVKLDLRLVQERPSVQIAEIANAVSAEAERTGTAVIAEGIETPAQVEIARALGAAYGQGWLFGRPGPVTTGAGATAVMPVRLRTTSASDRRTPFELVASGRELRRGDKHLLLTISRQLERQAMVQGSATVLMASFQEARHFTPATAAVYSAFARSAAFVGALARDLPSEPAPGVRAAALGELSDLAREWNVTVTSPHFAAAFAARDLGDAGGPDMARRFDFALTYDRDLAVAAARVLMRAVAPRGAES